jgi:hypothetical protein
MTRRTACAKAAAAARADAQLRKDLGPRIATGQVVFWMREITEIVLLDYLLSQQDRIGNIDYLPYWYWVEQGEVRRRPATGTTPPPDLAAWSPQLIKRTELGDNDAGVRTSHANFARRTGMLDGLRHLSATTYAQLQRLAQDFAAQGELHAYVRSTFGLSEREFARISGNVATAAATLLAACREQTLLFDLEPLEYLRTGRVRARAVSCNP